jgi:metallo-beta-lactamase class B
VVAATTPPHGDALPFPPVHVARTVADGDILRPGGLVLTAHATPGHTKGNTTWRSSAGRRPRP